MGRNMVYLLYALFFLFNFGVSYADEYHYVNFIIGERPSGLGGAYTALSDEPTGCYYNPAGIAFVPKRKFSISVNAYNIYIKKYKNALSATAGERKDWILRSSQLLPNFFGITQELGPGVGCFSYAVLDSFQLRQDQIFYNIKAGPADISSIDRYVLNIDDQDRTYNIGISYALKLQENLSTGATLYLHYRDARIIRNHFLDLTLTDTSKYYRWENYYLFQNEYGLRPIVGFLWKPIEKVSLGLSFSKTLILSSERKEQQVISGYRIPGESCYNHACIAKSSEKREFPYKTNFGIAYFPISSLLLSLDISYASKVKGKEAVLNGSVGMEYHITPSIIFRAGGFTDFANTPKLKSGKTDQPEHVDIYGGALSLSYIRKDSFFTVGALYTQGTGKAQVIPGSTNQQVTVLNNFNIYIGTGQSF